MVGLIDRIAAQPGLRRGPQGRPRSSIFPMPTVRPRLGMGMSKPGGVFPMPGRMPAPPPPSLGGEMAPVRPAPPPPPSMGGEMTPIRPAPAPPSFASPMSPSRVPDKPMPGSREAEAATYDMPVSFAPEPPPPPMRQPPQDGLDEAMASSPLMKRAPGGIRKPADDEFTY